MRLDTAPSVTEWRPVTALPVTDCQPDTALPVTDCQPDRAVSAISQPSGSAGSSGGETSSHQDPVRRISYHQPVTRQTQKTAAQTATRQPASQSPDRRRRQPHRQRQRQDWQQTRAPQPEQPFKPTPRCSPQSSESTFTLKARLCQTKSLWNHGADNREYLCQWW